MPVSRTLRFAVFERDGYTCRYCGKKAPEAALQLDHLVPTSMSGGNNIDNLLTACADCNTGKGSKAITRNPLAVPDDDHDNEELTARLKQMQARLALLMECGKTQDAILEYLDESMWKIVSHWQEYRGEKLETRKGETICTASYQICAVIRSLLARGTFEEVLACVDITLARHAKSSEQTAIKYLYGVFRNRAGLAEDAEANP